MAISPKDVEYLALLARLELTPEELKHFTSQLDEILAYVEKLKKVPTEGSPPTSRVLNLSSVFREDQPRKSLSPEAALSNAPSKEGPFFQVPKVIEGA